MLASKRILLHISDWHLASPHPSWSAIFNRRLPGYWRWKFLRGKRHSRLLLEKFIRLRREFSPSRVLVTGDLTHLGLPEEFEEAREFLKKLGPPEEVLVVPGNHDSYAPEPWQFTYAKWGRYLGEGNSLAEIFPRVTIWGPLALIGLSTACFNFPPFARGELGEEQLTKLSSLLEEAAREKLLRIIYLHHPPLEGVVSSRKALKDAKALEELIRRKGAELVLYGHTHKCFRQKLETSGGRCLLFGVPSLTYRGENSRRRARFYAFEFQKRALIFRSYIWAMEGFAPEFSLSFSI